jgi:hypothetical protein
MSPIKSDVKASLATPYFANALPDVDIGVKGAKLVQLEASIPIGKRC